MRIKEHPILGARGKKRKVFIEFDGRKIEAEEHEPIAAHGIARCDLRRTAERLP